MNARIKYYLLDIKENFISERDYPKDLMKSFCDMTPKEIQQLWLYGIKKDTASIEFELLTPTKPNE